MDILEHPHDKTRAIAVGIGKTHWVTDDEGATWREFKTEIPVSMSQVAFAFCASSPEFVLYSGSNECGLGDLLQDKCHDTVRIPSFEVEQN